MVRSKRLKPLARVAERRQLDAAARFRDTRERLAMYRSKLEEMQRYRAEYLEGFTDQGRAGMGADRIKSFRNFVAKLDETIDQLTELVDGERRQLEHDRTVWLAKRSRTRALDGAIGNLERAEELDKVLREDRETDERNLRKK